MFRYALLLIFVLSMPSLREAQRPSKLEMLQPILDVLDSANLSGSLEFSGSCDVQNLPEFPRLRTTTTGKGSPLQRLREIFADDPLMYVEQDGNGIIRMKESGVPSDVLNLEIRRIQFQSNGANGQWDIYTPNDALRFVLQAPEMSAFLKAHNIDWPYAGEMAPENIRAWPSEAPHISGSLDNVTVSEALDHILTRFPGIWAYENCPRSTVKNRVIYIRFFHLLKIGSAHIVADLQTSPL